MGIDKIKWLSKALAYIEKKLLGIRVPIEQGNERRNECLKCDMLKKTQIIPFVEIDICGLCKCPIDTKPFFYSHLLQSINPLIKRKKGQREIVKCPHPKGDKWAEIDKKYTENANAL